MRTLPPCLIVLGFGTFLFSLNYHLVSISIQALQLSSFTSQQPATSFDYQYSISHTISNPFCARVTITSKLESSIFPLLKFTQYLSMSTKPQPMHTHSICSKTSQTNIKPN
ncbi:expressed protein [Phakopsora pachyrhizi]|uniref:Expressed protein n=1 Tax=Phakopsora pachyrhizi TaxID=170000 RepID=A0AAV0ASY3_PHAPC|nr:expressed protein [Phakopsora pachyrhizi]